MFNYKLNIVLCWSVLGCLGLAECSDLFWTTDTFITKIAGLPLSPSYTTIHHGTTQRQIVGLGIDISDGLLFWTDLSSSPTEKGIWKSGINGENAQRILSGSAIGLEQPTGLAVDWVNKLLYWTDPDQRTVEICDYNGKKRLTLITHGLSHPRGIVSDPINGFLYIGDQDLHVIHRCRLDGKNCIVWMSKNQSSCTFWPNQLSINYNTRRLYWADGWTSSICSCKLDGTNCSPHNITVGRDSNVFGLGLMGSGGDTVIYYSGLHNSTVSVLDSSRNSVLTPGAKATKSYFIVSTDKTITQPNGNSPCSTTSCSDICVPTDQRSASCACPSYSAKVMINKQNCGTPEEILLYADTLAGEVGMVSAALKPIENVLHPSTLIARAENPVAVTFDSINNEVYFSDIGSSTIEKVKLDGTGRMELLNNAEGIDQVEGMAIDTKQRRLYFSNHGYTDKDSVAFWHKIEMISLDKTQRRTVITDVEKPRGIWIDSNKRYLYYTDWGSTPKVRKSTLDGLDIKDIGTQLISHQRPNGVAVIDDKIFIVDSDKKSTVEFIKPDGTKSGYAVTSQLAFPFGVTGNSDSLYVSDAGDTAAGVNSRLHFIPNNYPNNNNLTGSVIISGFQRLTGIHFLKKTSKYPQDLGVCTDSQNPCTRGSICTTKPTQNTATCLCQSNKLNYLDTDRKTCKTPKNNYMLIADVDGLKMASLESDSHVYTIRPGSGKCGPFKGLALDPYGKKIYYTESESGKIYRANIDGTNEEQLLEHEHRIEHITFSNDQLFWTSLYGCNDTMGGIYQWNLNPQSTPIELKMNVSQPHGIAANARYICWSDKAGINAYELTKKKFYMNLMPSGTSVRSLSLDDLGTLYISYSNGSLIARKFPNEPFRPALSINEGNLMPGEGMFVSGKYCYMVTSRNQIKLFDRLTKLSRTKNLNMGSLANPGQIVVIQDSSDLSSEQQDLIKPGVCSTSVTRNCASYDCNNDLVCGGNQKCCYNTGSCGASACEDPEISGDICQLNINGTRINWSEKQGKYSDGCIECDCTNPNCQLMCPQLTCSEADQVNGGCCQVCSSIKKCSEKPKISNCPTSQKTIELPADKSYVLLDHQNLKIESISAMSCDFQPVKLSPLMPNNVTWKQDPQKLRITATDKQGTDICEFQLKVNDNISPLITYCPSNINGIAKSNEGLKVEWLEPRATDNSGEVKIEYDPDSRKNGENFPVGLDILKYLVRDGAGNVNESCQFTVNITKKEISCHEPPVLQNGILRCSSSGGKTSCHIEKCNDGYVKFPDHDKIYECSTDGVWKPAFPELFKLEACFKPEPVEIKLPFFVTMIDCPIINFNKYYLLNCLSISNLCPAPGSKISLCKEDRITVTHSANTETTSVIGNTMGELPFGGDLNTVINDIHQANLRVVYFFSNKTYEILCPKLACDIDINKTRSALTSEAKESCPVGSEYHKDVNGKPACIKCSPGKYYKGTRCAKCLKGTYQEDPGQILCLECKTGTTTIKEAAYREAHCIKITEDPRGTDIGLILGLVITALLVIVIALGVVFLIKRRRQREAIKKGQYESSSDVKDKRVSDVYDELKEDEYNVIPADHVPSNPDDAGNDGYASPKDMPSVGNDGYASPKDMPGVGNDGYATPKDMPNTGNDGYVMSKDAQKNRALPNPYAQLGSKKDGDKDYEGLLTSPYEKLQASKEKEETYTNPVYIGNIN